MDGVVAAGVRPRDPYLARGDGHLDGGHEGKPVVTSASTTAALRNLLVCGVALRCDSLYACQRWYRGFISRQAGAGGRVTDKGTYVHFVGRVGAHEPGRKNARL